MAWVGALFNCCSGDNTEALLFLTVVAPGGVAFFAGTWVVVQNGTLRTSVRLVLFLLYCPLASFVLLFVGLGSLLTLGHGS